MDLLSRMERMILDEKVSKEEAKVAIMEFLATNPSPPDDDIHAMADKLGVDVHVFESYIYSILGSILGAGRAKEKGFTEKDADPAELKLGMKVEMEHTTDPLIAKRISLDHLVEIKDYYTRLIKMEKEAGITD